MTTTLKVAGMARLVLVVEGSGIGVRVCPSKKNEDELVLKAPTPDAGALLCQLMGIECGPTFKGSNFFITPVKAEAFQNALAGFTKSLMATAKEADKAKAEAKAQAHEADLAAAEAEAAEMLKNEAGTEPTGAPLMN